MERALAQNSRAIARVEKRLEEAIMKNDTFIARIEEKLLGGFEEIGLSLTLIHFMHPLFRPVCTHLVTQLIKSYLQNRPARLSKLLA